MTINNDCLVKIFSSPCIEYKQVSDMRLVCKLWKEAADNANLWENKLISLKDKEFTSRNIPNPRNFIVLDKILTKAIHEIVANKESHLKNAQLISLCDPDRRIILVKFNETAKYCLRLTEECVEEMKNSSCLDYPKWLNSVKKVAETIASLKLNFQTSVNFPDRPDFLVKLQEKFNKPDAKMKQLIQDYQITDLFIFANRDCYITASNKLNLTLLQDAVEGNEAPGVFISDADLLGLFKLHCQNANQQRAMAVWKEIMKRLSASNSKMEGCLNLFKHQNPDLAPFFTF